ncbi:hypothetical protein BDZ85DRAFT_98908 [Elsinoe ampelina]|uniref:Uncharacterized protein n=1 Tax=Elsinoe ampelina TaxID=302913 RepID=A0A6A6GEV5_9PEZI|nr:hypothetical protein BDZ85DRAFT_98908 [Elsinoe ampelina]
MSLLALIGVLYYVLFLSSSCLTRRLAALSTRQALIHHLTIRKMPTQLAIWSVLSWSHQRLQGAQSCQPPLPPLCTCQSLHFDFVFQTITSTYSSKHPGPSAA